MNWRRRVPKRTLDVCSLGLLTACLTVLVTSGCSKEPEQKGQAGESCTVNADCEQPLLCRDGTCTGGSSADAGPDGSQTDGGGSEVEAENYYISYMKRDQLDSEATPQLRVYSTASKEHKQVSPDSMTCWGNCWLTRDMNHFVYTEDAGGGVVDVRVADVGEDLTVSDEESTLAEEVEEVHVERNYVSYIRAGEEGRTAFYKKASGGEATRIGTINGRGDWIVEPEADVGLIFSVGDLNQTMNVDVGKASSRESDVRYTLGGQNFQRESGSYFGRQVNSATSRDGRLAAFVTDGAPNDGDYCTREEAQNAWSSSQCNGDNYYKCGNENRCTRLEITVHTIDTQNRQELGKQCSSADECSPYHECYIPSPQRKNEAECIPGRTVLGVPQTPQGPNRETGGCQIVAEDDSIDFTGVSAPLSFDGNKNLVLIGTRDRSCLGDYETDVSQIVRVNPKEKSYEILEGFGPQSSYDSSKCWDNTEDDIDIEGCRVYADSAMASPKGNEIAFMATNPRVQTVGQADSSQFIWHMLRNGQERWYSGDKEVESTVQVTGLRVHSRD